MMLRQTFGGRVTATTLFAATLCAPLMALCVGSVGCAGAVATKTSIGTDGGQDGAAPGTASEGGMGVGDGGGNTVPPLPFCDPSASSSSPCDIDAAVACQRCVEGAGNSCFCSDAYDVARPDGGAIWVCVGTEHPCQ